MISGKGETVTCNRYHRKNNFNLGMVLDMTIAWDKFYLNVLRLCYWNCKSTFLKSSFFTYQCYSDLFYFLTNTWIDKIFVWHVHILTRFQRLHYVCLIHLTSFRALNKIHNGIISCIFKKVVCILKINKVFSYELVWFHIWVNITTLTV